VINLQIESWAAMAPGLENKQDWQQWLRQPTTISEPYSKPILKQISPLLRRRLSTLGACAVGAAQQLVVQDELIPSIFASRHGNAALSLSLQQSMGLGEPMSPTHFSLAVHNSISGLFSIARKDTSEVSSIACMEGLILNTLFEAVGQLQNSDKVLCVIYDAPLPDLYRQHGKSVAFPYAIAIKLCRSGGDSYNIVQLEKAEMFSEQHLFNTEPLRFLELLSCMSKEMTTNINGAKWCITRAHQ